MELSNGSHSIIEIGTDALETISYENPKEPQEDPSINILNQKFIKFDEKFIIEFKKENFKKLDREVKRNCKILKFSTEWSVEEIFMKIRKLNHREFSNLFIFVIETQNAGEYLNEKNLKQCKIIERFIKCINKFTNDRPLVIQMTSVEENVTKIFYKEENITKFLKIKQQNENFSAFLNFLKNAEIEIFEKVMLENLPDVENSALIIRFLRTLKLSDKFFKNLILKCAKCGSKDDLLASIDANFGNLLNFEAQEYLANVIYEEVALNEEFSESNQKNPGSTDLMDQTSNKSSEAAQEEIPNNDTKSTISEYSAASTTSHLNPSILYEAIKNSNKEVINYLISYCSHLIHQLPFKHKVRISTAAHETNQIDELCDLIEISDFPFPEDFEGDSSNHERLNEIIKTRTEFEVAINTENLNKISKFIENNSNLKIVYNSNNISALKHAINHKKYKIYFYLKSFGFQASEFHSLDEALSETELKKANKIKSQQRRSNVNDSVKNVQNSVMLLCTRSSIHNRKIKKELQQEYHARIRKWFEDINKIEFGPELLAVTASCESLRIIFDFESYSVRNCKSQRAGK